MDAERLPSDDSLTNSPLRGYSRFTFACHLRFCHLCSESFCRDLGAGLFRTGSGKSAGCSAGISEEGTREHIDENCYLYTPMICVSLPNPSNRNTCNQQRRQAKNVLDVITPFACRRNAQNKNCGLLLSPWRNNDVYAREFKSL